ncbi:hypothetical protein [Dankookia sp. P2]|uniref:hypothetical protein n=1 Tax=Dankookia sp. P2 TaxID=3423955 RepID=UPI003D6742D2
MNRNRTCAALSPEATPSTAASAATEPVITVSGHQPDAAVEAEFGRLAGFLAAATPAARFTSDLLRLDGTGSPSPR